MKAVTFPVRDDDLYYFLRNKRNVSFYIIWLIKNNELWSLLWAKGLPVNFLLHKLRLKRDKFETNKH